MYSYIPERACDNCWSFSSSNNWYAAVAGLHPQSLRHSALYPSLRVSQTLGPSYLSHCIAAAT